jgi:hypothetical protein
MAVISLHIRGYIEASVKRVWRALCDPDEVVQWDSSVLEALDAPFDYPQPGQDVRWRCRSGLFRILNDRPQEVVPQQKLRSLLDIGLVRMDETYALIAVPDGCRIDLLVGFKVRFPCVAGIIQRDLTGPNASRGFEASLAALKRHCEAPHLDKR